MTGDEIGAGWVQRHQAAFRAEPARRGLESEPVTADTRPRLRPQPPGTYSDVSEDNVVTSGACGARTYFSPWAEPTAGLRDPAAPAGSIPPASCLDAVPGTTLGNGVMTGNLLSASRLRHGGPPAAATTETGCPSPGRPPAAGTNADLFPNYAVRLPAVAGAELNRHAICRSRYRACPAGQIPGCF